MAKRSMEQLAGVEEDILSTRVLKTHSRGLIPVATGIRWSRENDRVLFAIAPKFDRLYDASSLRNASPLFDSNAFKLSLDTSALADKD